jgi:hypothetical protein
VGFAGNKTKRCYKCEIDKVLREFYKDSSKIDGLCPQCKECKNKQIRAYNATPRGKEVNKRYKNSTKGQVVHYRYRGGIKNKVLTHYSISNIPMCAAKGCTIMDVDMLCIDHIDNGGNKHRKETGSGGKVYGWLIKHGLPPGYQVLCWNHNAKKEIERARGRSRLNGNKA